MLFPDWETFYVIVGSSAGALTGLMFVVIALIANHGSSAPQVEAFGTPTIVHFGAALLLSAMMTAPWPALLPARLALAAFGAVGALYVLIVLRRARRQTDYRPVFEDWLFHAALPLVAYIGIVVGAAWVRSRNDPLLFVIGAAAVLLVFIGIHNTWDTVTYIVVTRWEKRRERSGE